MAPCNKKQNNLAMNIGAIFDWDGVVIDSSRHHEESWERLAREERKSLPPGHFKKGFGMKNEFIIPHFLAWTSNPEEVHRLSLRKEALYRDIILEWGIDALPGVRGFLQRLKIAGIPCSIGSSTHRQNITTSLERMNLGGMFDAITTAEDVRHGKPDPEVFLTAARKINRPPEQCVVFEDAYVGIDAARAGGMKVVAVATTNPINTLGNADRTVHRLDELSVDDLHALFG
jgi:beta-phosphoglucomutase family hydrolase